MQAKGYKSELAYNIALC